jgi:hypothetical protein
VSQETHGDAGVSSSWGTHRTQDGHILDEHELQVLSVVPALVVHVLSQDLDRGLGAVSLLLGHVQVINEDDALLAHGGSVIPSSPLVHLGIDGVLGLIGRGLGREGNGDVLVVVTHLVELGVDVHRLTGTGGAGTQHVVTLLDQHGGEVGVTGGVHVGDHDLVVLVVVVDLELLEELVPGHELTFGGIEVVVIDGAFGGEHIGEFLDVQVELVSAFGVTSAPEGPGQSEHEDSFDGRR